MKKLLLAVALVAGLPAHAQTFHSSSGLRVTPEGPKSFRISGVARNTPQSHWCAAAEYSFKVLGARFDQRMYVVGDLPRGQRTYLISLDPSGTASEGGRIKEWGVRIDGANRRVDEGLDFCEGFLLRRGS